MTVCGFRFCIPRPWVIKTFYGDNDGVRTINGIFAMAKVGSRASASLPMSVQPPVALFHTHKLVRGAETLMPISSIARSRKSQ